MTQHLAAIAWPLDLARRRILLVHHRFFGWSCPGGHVEPGESVAEAAVRELFEETGVVSEPIGPAFRIDRNDRCPRDADAYDLLHHFRFEVDSTATLVVSEHGQPAKWFDWDALPTARTADLDVVLSALRG
ncbi:MAG TPA: NUDIX hydrolase [Ilumatobacter sp.]|nr:NUDIX hydrolase [Ilumatobacter sp.]